MVHILDDVSRTFSEYLILPNLTKVEHSSDQVMLKSPLAKFNKGEESCLYINIPLMSSAMQAVSCPNLAITLAMHGGLASIHCSQSIENQAEMIRAVKKFKAGFVKSSANIRLDGNLEEIRKIAKETQHSTLAVTTDGSPQGKFHGIIFAKDIWPGEPGDRPVSELMIGLDKIQYANVGISLEKAISLLRECNQKSIPVLSKNGSLDSFVFRRDAFSLNEFPLQMLDNNGRLMVSAAINTHDYVERVTEIMEAGADLLFFDSSDGYSEYQKKASQWVRARYGKKIIIGGGNIVCSRGFMYLVKECDVDFVKVGIGGGSICVTREQKGIGRGQASALMEVVETRNNYYHKTGIYIPICSDGGLANDTQIIIAFAMGADFVMMGKYFASLEESASTKVNIRGKTYKSYWGEGSSKAKNWQRYSNNSISTSLQFEEGVDAYVPCIGKLSDILPTTLSKLKSTMVNCGSLSLGDFTNEVRLTLISNQTFIEGGTSNVLSKEIFSQM